MYLSTLKLWNFRKYSEGPDGKPGLVVHFHGTEGRVPVEEVDPRIEKEE